VFNYFFFPEDRAFYEVMWKNMAEPDFHNLRRSTGMLPSIRPRCLPLSSFAINYLLVFQIIPCCWWQHRQIYKQINKFPRFIGIRVVTEWQVAVVLSDVEISVFLLKYEVRIRHQKKLFYWRQNLPADVVDFFIAIWFQLLKLWLNNALIYVFLLRIVLLSLSYITHV